jgi:SAM-dependent methyltransferase
MGVSEGNLLDIGAAGGYLVKLASERGFDAQGVEISEHAVEIAQSVIPGKVQRGTLDKLQLEPSCLDVITLFDVLEHLAEPREALQRLSGWLKPGGVIAVTIPDVDSLSARLMGGAWPHYKLEHRFYPSRRGLRMMLGGAGLEVVLDKSAKKCISLDFTAPLLRRYPVRLLTPIFDILHRAMPKAIRDASFEVSIGERLCIGRKG